MLNTFGQLLSTWDGEGKRDYLPVKLPKRDSVEDSNHFDSGGVRLVVFISLSFMPIVVVTHFCLSCLVLSPWLSLSNSFFMSFYGTRR